MWGPNKPGYRGLLPRRRNHAGQRPEVARVSAPIARNIGFEGRLCEAIAQGVAVRLLYPSDSEPGSAAWRQVLPLVVYLSRADRATMIGEDHKTTRTGDSFICIQHFEVDRILALELSDVRGAPSWALDFTQEKFTRGMICRR